MYASILSCHIQDMMTWEVLRDTGIHTYHMEDNPEYAYIIFTRYIMYSSYTHRYTNTHMYTSSYQSVSTLHCIIE
jgi:hypothetical protein